MNWDEFSLNPYPNLFLPCPATVLATDGVVGESTELCFHSSGMLSSLSSSTVTAMACSAMLGFGTKLHSFPSTQCGQKMIKPHYHSIKQNLLFHFKVWDQLPLSEVGNMHSGKGRAISFRSACHGKEGIVFSALVMDAIDEVGKWHKFGFYIKLVFPQQFYLCPASLFLL